MLWARRILPPRKARPASCRRPTRQSLDSVAAGANKTIVDTALSTTSGNPVQNKVVKAALDAMDTTAIPTSAIDALFV